MPDIRKKSFLLDEGIVPLIDCIMRKLCIPSFDQFVMMAIEEFILTKKHELPHDLQDLPLELHNQRIRQLIDKEVEGLNQEVGFIEDIKTRLDTFGRCNATIDYYSLYYLSCKKKMLTFKNKKKLIIRMNKIFKDHLQTLMKLRTDTNEDRNPIKRLDIIKFVRNNMLIDKKEFEEFMIGTKENIKVLS